MAARRRPLRAFSLVFAGFVILVLLSQLSAHFFAAAIPNNLVPKNEAVLRGIQQTSTQLAFAASALGLVFAVAVLVITRARVAADTEVYRAAGLPPSSTFFRLVRSHSVVPLEWVVGVTFVASFVDLSFRLDALIPIGLAVCFTALLFAWLALLTSISFSRKTLEGMSEGRAG